MKWFRLFGASKECEKEEINSKKCSDLRAEVSLPFWRFFTAEYKCLRENKEMEIAKQKLHRKWEIINYEIQQRENAAKKIICVLPDYKNEQQKRVIAETVMTLENAQTYLTEKAEKFYFLGVITASIAFIVMLGMGLYMLEIPPMPKSDPNSTISFESNTITAVKLSSGKTIELPIAATKLKDINATEITITESSHIYDFIAYAMKRLAGGGFMAGLVIFLIYLARSFFHESTAFKNERHNIRLGKLIPYAVAPEKMNYKVFQEVTQWGKESHSSFKDIKPEASGKTILTYSVEALKAMSETVKNIKEKDNEKSKGEKPNDN